MRKVAILICVCGGALLCAATFRIFAETAANPYQGIVDRNVFNLKPPPVQAPPAPPPAPPPPRIILNGILSLGKKRALLQTPGAAKPGQVTPLESYILGEGEQDGGILVVEIDEKAGTVKVNNHGTPQTLDFENNGAKMPMVAGMTLPAFQSTPGVIQGRFQVPTNPNPAILSRIPRVRLPPVAPPNAAPGQGVPATPGVIAPQAQSDLTPEQAATLAELRARLQIKEAQPEVAQPIPAPSAGPGR